MRSRLFFHELLPSSCFNACFHTAVRLRLIVVMQNAALEGCPNYPLTFSRTPLALLLTSEDESDLENEHLTYGCLLEVALAIAHNGSTENCDKKIASFPPFCASTAHETYQNVMSWRETLKFPPETPISKEAHDLITLLCTDAESRLGSNGGLEQFRKHPFFDNVDWENIRERPAAIPVQIRSIDDTTNFDEFPDEDLTWPNVTDPKKSYKKDLAFINYTYKAFDGCSSCDRRLARPSNHHHQQRHVRPCPAAGTAAPSQCSDSSIFHRMGYRAHRHSWIPSPLLAVFLLLLLLLISKSHFVYLRVCVTSTTTTNAVLTVGEANIIVTAPYFRPPIPSPTDLRSPSTPKPPHEREGE
ncbi:unnamed protein product [Mesocestoides corti]|uniref:non-specific serine/threonine protein kinase n=1 Tax=Mesocestoides corti TaxID=53468 RepID=A0A0R3U7N1_MESCO|nr:unnamed protein product [Mesocestoides corti]